MPLYTVWMGLLMKKRIFGSADCSCTLIDSIGLKNAHKWLYLQKNGTFSFIVKVFCCSAATLVTWGARRWKTRMTDDGPPAISYLFNVILVFLVYVFDALGPAATTLDRLPCALLFRRGIFPGLVGFFQPYIMDAADTSSLKWHIVICSSSSSLATGQRAGRGTTGSDNGPRRKVG